MSILDFLGKEILYFDGAMGTRLQAAGLKPGELPEVWNITHGDVVAEIHASYVRLKMQELPLPGCPKSATTGEGIRLL